MALDPSNSSNLEKLALKGLIFIATSPHTQHQAGFSSSRWLIIALTTHRPVFRPSEWDSLALNDERYANEPAELRRRRCTASYNAPRSFRGRRSGICWAMTSFSSTFPAESRINRCLGDPKLSIDPRRVNCRQIRLRTRFKATSTFVHGSRTV